MSITRVISWLIGSLALSLWGTIGPAFGKVMILSDFDNTFVENRRHHGGTFHTTVRLFRIPTQASLMEASSAGPEVVDLTHDDLEQISQYLAPSLDIPGPIRKQVTLESGIQFDPSYYFFKSPESYIRFGALPNTPDVHWLMEDLKAAGKSGWKGPFFQILQEFLASEEGAQSVGILTARGHSREVWHHFFTYLRDQGEIHFLPEPHNYHSVGRSGHENKYDHIKDIPSRKAEVLREYALELANTPLTDQDEVLGPDGKTTERMHFLVFADDHPEIIEKALELFQSLAQQDRMPVKFALFNSGLDSQVKESRRPRFIVIQSNGSVRALRKGELKAPMSAAVACESVFKLLGF